MSEVDNNGPGQQRGTAAAWSPAVAAAALGSGTAEMTHCQVTGIITAAAAAAVTL